MKNHIFNNWCENFGMFLFNLIFISLLGVIILFIFYYNNKNENYLKLLVVLFSCDRTDFLNQTISSFYYHMRNYESNIIFNFYFVDSGTSNRLEYVEEYSIKNTIFMNPNGPHYGYEIIWSYLHGKYILLLEDDRVFIKNIEKKIFYPNFIEESILILDETDEIKGIVLKTDPPSISEIKTIKTNIGNHTLCVLKHPPWGYYYVNGPAIYSIKYLLQVGPYISENNMAGMFNRLKWYIGFTYKGIKCNESILMTLKCQGLTIHLGEKKSTLTGKMCRYSMY